MANTKKKIKKAVKKVAKSKEAKEVVKKEKGILGDIMISLGRKLKKK